MRRLLNVTLQLQESRIAEVPPVEGLDPAVVVRALYRAALDASSGAWPLVQLDMAFVPPGARALDDSLDLAAGGWLHLGPGWTEAQHRLLVREAPSRRVNLLLSGYGPVIPLGANEAAQVLLLDRLHLVAMDPALRQLRLALLAFAQGPSHVHLTGEPGTGKRLLVQWAHAAAGRGTLAHCRKGQHARPEPAQWALFEELSELDAEQRRALEARVARSEPVMEAPENGPQEAASRPRSASSRILGDSPNLLAVLQHASDVAEDPRPVLILGESGTGKELLAREIHALSGREGQPFCAINCSTIPRDLAESVLFGHARGAFTDARADHAGLFESAGHGTVFLDEIGDFPAELQPKLLRVLQEGEVVRVGESRPRPVHARVLAATHANLAERVETGEFRRDLYMRLRFHVLELPPLRERREDVLLLARRFLARELEGKGRALPSPWITEAGRRALLRHDWPGNVRELEAVVAEAARRSGRGRTLDIDDLVLPREVSAPTFTTSSAARAGAETWGLGLRAANALSAVSLRLPSLRERSLDQRRALILALLQGHPIEPEALDLLARRPWWRNLTELCAVMSSLVKGTPDVVRTAAVLPLRSVGAVAPIRVLLEPGLDAQGGVRGLSELYDAACLVIGRVSSASELRRLLAEHPERYGALPELIADPAAFLNLSVLPLLSRVHALVTRSPRGLVVHAALSRALELRAGPLGPDAAPPRPATPGRPVELGRAGELVVWNEPGAPYLRLFVLEGPDLGAAEQALIAARLGARPAPPTMPEALPFDHADNSGCWALDEAERALLSGLLIRFPGGSFKHWLDDQLRARRGQPSAARLLDYFTRTRNAGDYCGRLFEAPYNEPLRREFAELLSSRPEAAERLTLLPVRVRRLFNLADG